MILEDTRQREVRASEAPAKQEHPGHDGSPLEWKELARVAFVAMAAAAV